jgi:hypothetical protein
MKYWPQVIARAKHNSIFIKLMTLFSKWEFPTMLPILKIIQNWKMLIYVTFHSSGKLLSSRK